MTSTLIMFGKKISMTCFKKKYKYKRILRPASADRRTTSLIPTQRGFLPIPSQARTHDLRPFRSRLLPPFGLRPKPNPYSRARPGQPNPRPPAPRLTRVASMGWPRRGGEPGSGARVPPSSAAPPWSGTASPTAPAASAPARRRGRSGEARVEVSTPGELVGCSRSRLKACCARPGRAGS